MSTRSGGRRSVASMGAELSDADLRARLMEYGLAVGPVTATTRSVMLKKLEALRAGSSKRSSTSRNSSGKLLTARGDRSGKRGAPTTFSSDSDDDDDDEEEEEDDRGRGGTRPGERVRPSEPKTRPQGADVEPGLSRSYQRTAVTATRDVGTDPRKKAAAFRENELYSDDDGGSRGRGGGGGGRRRRGYDSHTGGSSVAGDAFAWGAEQEVAAEEMDASDGYFSGGAPASRTPGFQSDFARHLEAGGSLAPVPATSGNNRRSGLDMNYPSSAYSSSSAAYSSTAAAAAPMSSPSRSLLSGFTSRYSSDLGGLGNDPIGSLSSSGLRLRDGLDGGGGGHQSSEPQELDRPRSGRFPDLSGRGDIPSQSSGNAPSSYSFTSPSSWFTSRGGSGGGGGGGGGERGDGGGGGVGGGGGSTSGVTGSRDSPFASSASRLYPTMNYSSRLQPDADCGLGRGGGGGTASSFSSSNLGQNRAQLGNFGSYGGGGGAGGEGRVEAKRAPLVSAAVRRRGGPGTAAAAASKQAAPGGPRKGAVDSFPSRYKSNMLRIGLGTLLVWMAVVYVLTCGQDSDDFKAPCETKECEKQGINEIYGKMHSLLSLRAGEHQCGYLPGQQAELSVESVKADPEIKSYGEDMFNKALDAIVKGEARLGIKVRGLEPYSSVATASEVRFLESLHPQRSFVCRLHGAIVQTIVRLLLIFIAIAILWGLYLYAKLWFKQREERKKQVFELVEKISDMLQQQLLDSQTNWRVQPYLLIPHVRDSIIKPQDRARMRPVWDEAVQFIDAGESRIRTETQLLHGQDCEVWRWTSSPTSPGQSPAAS